MGVSGSPGMVPPGSEASLLTGQPSLELGWGPAYGPQRSAGIERGNSGLDSWDPALPPDLTCSVAFSKCFLLLVLQFLNLLLHVIQSCLGNE